MRGDFDTSSFGMPSSCSIRSPPAASSGQAAIDSTVILDHPSDRELAFDALAPCRPKPSAQRGVLRKVDQRASRCVRGARRNKDTGAASVHDLRSSAHQGRTSSDNDGESGSVVRRRHSHQRCPVVPGSAWTTCELKIPVSGVRLSPVHQLFSGDLAGSRPGSVQEATNSLRAVALSRHEVGVEADRQLAARLEADSWGAQPTTTVSAETFAVWSGSATRPSRRG